MYLKYKIFFCIFAFFSFFSCKNFAETVNSQTTLNHLSENHLLGQVKQDLENTPGYPRDISQTYFVVPEWLLVDLF
ncbi:MAG: hypothetical protein K2X39_06875, partial [Silvanigrellaceae bacterium]|nr:hypothetical protein [Silvanigrellaceae bacterium]